MSTQFDGAVYVPLSTPLIPPVAEPPGAIMRFQFAGVITQCVPACAAALFHVWMTDCPAGMSNSSLQSESGAMLMLVMVKLAMKPVCHVDVTLSVATAAAA